MNTSPSTEPTECQQESLDALDRENALAPTYEAEFSKLPRKVLLMVYRHHCERYALHLFTKLAVDNWERDHVKRRVLKRLVGRNGAKIEREICERIFKATRLPGFAPLSFFDAALLAPPSVS